jgi:hypothetical protein
MSDDNLSAIVQPPKEPEQRKAYADGFDAALTALAGLLDCDLTLREALECCQTYLDVSLNGVVEQSPTLY